MRVQENSNVLPFDEAPMGPASFRWSGMLNSGDGSNPALLGPRAEARDEVQEFVDPDGDGIANNTDAIAHAIMGDVSAKLATQELIALEQIIKDVLWGQNTPSVQFADNLEEGEVLEDKSGNVLPANVNGAYVSGGLGKAGTILISNDLKDDRAKLAEVMLEEVGEAISDHAGNHGFQAAAGDVGDRIRQVVREPWKEVTFEVTGGGLDEAAELDPNTNYDEQYVLLDGKKTAAKTATEDELDLAALAAEWDTTEAEVLEAYNIAEENFARRDAEFLWADDPDVDNEAEWGRFVTVYGNGNKIGIYGMARAIIDGAMKIADNMVNENSFAGIDLNQVGNGVLTDKIWTHAEEAAGDGVDRDQISLTLLSDAVAYVTGDAAGFADNGTNWETIQDNFADMTEAGETRQSGAEGPTRFSKEAIESIWDSGAFTVTGIAEDGSITFEVDAAAALAAETSTDDGEAWRIGTGYSAFGVPPDAEYLVTDFVKAEDNPLGVDSNMVTYTLAEDPDTTYVVAYEANDPNQLIRAATVVDHSEGTVHIYDSEGTLEHETTLSDVSGMMVEETGRFGTVVQDELTEWVNTNGHEFTGANSSPDIAYVLYIDKDSGEEFMRYQWIGDNGETEPVETVLLDSDEAFNVLDAYDSSLTAYFATPEDRNDTRRRLRTHKDDAVLAGVGWLALESTALEAGILVASGPIGWGIIAGVAIAEGFLVGAALWNGYKAATEEVAAAASDDTGKNAAGDAVLSTKGQTYKITLGPNPSARTTKMPPGDDGDEPTPPPVSGSVVPGHYIDMPPLLITALQDYSTAINSIVSDLRFVEGATSDNATPEQVNAAVINLRGNVAAVEAMALQDVTPALESWWAENLATGGLTGTAVATYRRLTDLLDNRDSFAESVAEHMRHIEGIYGNGDAVFPIPGNAAANLFAHLSWNLINRFESHAGLIAANPDIFH